MQAMLAFENAPPLTAPLRFFLTAPLFGLLAGLLIAVEGADIFASRWMPGALAATHLMTVGFMLQVMLGALIQILPVVAGAKVVAEVVGHGRHDKVRIVKMRRRKHYRKQQGHRQWFTELKITGITV